MQVSKAVRIWIDYHKGNSRRSTVQACEGTISKFVDVFGLREMGEVTTEEVPGFQNDLTDGGKPCLGIYIIVKSYQHPVICQWRRNHLPQSLPESLPGDLR